MVQKATLAQVRMGKNGRMIEIDQDVQYICDQVKQIDPSLGIDYSEDGDYFRITELCVDGRKRMVCAVKELTADLPEYLRKVLKTDPVKEMDRLDAQYERDGDHRLHELVGPIGEKLNHAIRKDLLYKGRAFIPRDI